MEKNVILVCGLNGVGKSTFAKALAKEIGARFLDAEDVPVLRVKEKRSFSPR